MLQISIAFSLAQIATKLLTGNLLRISFALGGSTNTHQGTIPGTSREVP